MAIQRVILDTDIGTNPDDCLRLPWFSLRMSWNWWH
jgi:hypothetical protein